jgi:hypothetical protein
LIQINPSHRTATQRAPASAASNTGTRPKDAPDKPIKDSRIDGLHGSEGLIEIGQDVVNVLDAD